MASHAGDGGGETKGEGEIVEVFQKGYVLNERLLRPAMVKVSALAAGPAELARA